MAATIGGMQVTEISGAVEMMLKSAEHKSFDNLGYCDHVDIGRNSPSEV